MILKISKNVAAVAGVFALTMVCVSQTPAAQIIVKEFKVEKSSVPFGSSQGGPQTKPTAKITFNAEYLWSSSNNATYTVSYGSLYQTIGAQGSSQGPSQAPLPATLNSSSNTFNRDYTFEAYGYATSLTVNASGVTQIPPQTGRATLAP
jgi:hypothetical protein